MSIKNTSAETPACSPTKKTSNLRRSEQAAELELGYRTSRIQKEALVALKVTICL